MKGSHEDRRGASEGPAPLRLAHVGSSAGWSGHGARTSSRYLPRFFVESPQLLGPPHFPTLSQTVTLGQELTLGPEDAHHALRVLRLQLGDECEVVVTPPAAGAKELGTSRGEAYLATVSAAMNEVRVTLTAHLQGRQAGAHYLAAVGVVQAMTRPSAMDYLLEKGTEVGAGFFLVVPGTGSSSRPRTAKSARLTRWRRIVREASKQSKQLAIPSVDMLGSVDEAVDRLGPESFSLVLDPEAPDGLFEFLSSTWGVESSTQVPCPDAPPARVALWVGPESGWSSQELAALEAASAGTVRLGQSVLRTETAGPVAVAVTRLALGDW